MSNDALLEADKRAFSAVGIPSWAQVTGTPDWMRPRLFAWVDDESALHARLVGAAELANLRLLATGAAEVLSGQNDFATHGEPAGLGETTALAVVHEHAVGYGSMGRSGVRPLAEVVQFAQDIIEGLIDAAGPV